MASDESALKKPPFIDLDGVFNARSVGGFRTSSVSEHQYLKHPILFRTGELSSITEEGKRQIYSLGIRKVFDLRTLSEIKGYGAEVPEIPNIEIEKIPIESKPKYPPISLDERLKKLETNEIEMFCTMAQEVVEALPPALEKILDYMKEHPDNPCLIHCTAGKDRTGLATAIILKLLGAPEEEILKDYALSVVGIEPAAPMLAQRLAEIPAFASNPAGTLIMGGAKPESLTAILERIRSKWGGVEEYLKTYGVVTEEEIVHLRSLYVTTERPKSML